MLKNEMACNVMICQMGPAYMVCAARGLDSGLNGALAWRLGSLRQGFAIPHQIQKDFKNHV